MKKVDKFNLFLQKHRALGKFYLNVEKGRETTFPVAEKLKDDKMGVISGAFIWEDTPEGHDYWCDLDDIWRMTNERQTKRN